MSTKNEAKASIIDYVENFIDKRDNELRATADEDDETRVPRGVDRSSIIITSGADNYRGEEVDKRISDSTDIDAGELNLEADPIIETQEGGDQVYKQQVYLRQYQPPTPDPIDIQIQEVVIKPQVQRPPIHVYVGPGQNREALRTPSPILIKSVPPQSPPTPPSQSIVYNKYVPIDYNPPPQQIIIHRFPEMPPKPRPIVVEQWLPNKPAPKRITYHHVNRDEYVQNEFKRQRNRFIEYTKPRTTVELEIIRLPIITLRPDDYHRQSVELTKLDKVRSITQDPNTLQWRI